MTRLLSLVLLSSAVLWGGCSTTGTRSRSGIHLIARLGSPTDIKLEWNDDRHPDAAGHIVEWATDPKGDYVILAFADPRTASFVHSDLMPETRCCYRIRAYIGPASEPVTITTGKLLPNEEVQVTDPTWADPKVTTTATPSFSIRDPSTRPHAAPATLQAKLVHPTGIQFHWSDRARDEEGFMLEMKTPADPDFHICAMMPPDVTSFGYAQAPPETRVQFRVRAFYYSDASNIAREKNGAAAFAAEKRSSL